MNKNNGTANGVPAPRRLRALIIPLAVALAAAAVFPASAGGRTEAVGSPGEHRQPGTPITIVATTGMVGDLARAVAGEAATVQVLMGEEVDPHLYRPTRADVARLQQADIIFYNGLNLEGRMGDTLVQLARTRPVFAVTELISEDVLLDDEEYEEAFDPHLWMDVSLWMEALEVVTTALVELAPDHETLFRENAAAFRIDLEETHAYIREIMATIPEDRRVLITAHDAFGYFGRAYNIEVLGVQGISTESEAGLQDINNLVQLVVNRGVTAVFAESTVPERSLMAVIEGAAARGHTVAIGGELFADAMGPAGTYEGTYLGMMDHNATTIVRALGGTAPERGFRGRLSLD